MNNVPQSVLETIAKLANMSVERGCTPAEAANAAAHLERLLEKHQLSLFDVKTQTYKEDVRERSFKVGLKLMPEWMLALAGCIARPHDCECFMRRHHGTGMTADGRHEIVDVSVTFIGHSTDVEVCEHLFRTLSKLLSDMANRDAAKIGRKGSHLFQFRKQYLTAAAWEISKRLTDERDTVRRETGSTSTALVVVKDKQVAEYMAKNHANVRPAKRVRKRWDNDAVEMGREAGRTAPIRKEVERRDDATLLLQ